MWPKLIFGQPVIYNFSRPSSILEPFIKYYWILESDKSNQLICKERIFPTGFIEIIFYYGDQYLKINKNNQSVIQPKCQINGQSTGYYDIMPTGKIGLISVVLKPNAARLFFNLPVSELTNHSLDIANIEKHEIKRLENAIQIATNNNERIKAIENYFYNQLIEKKLYDFKRINHCIEKINQKKGLITLKELATESFLCQKQFNRKFSDFVGLNPKQFLRIIRFQHAIFSYQNNPSVNFTELAYTCGYFDQSHFIHEFKTFTGLTPTELFKSCQPYSDYFSQ